MDGHAGGGAKGALRWVSSEEGGRKVPFAGEQYSGVARFPGHTGHWSVVVDFDLETGPLEEHQVELSFLIADAPQGLFVPGTRFELVEGERVVAIVEINPT